MTLADYLDDVVAFNDKALSSTAESDTSGTLVVTTATLRIHLAPDEGVLGRVYWRAYDNDTSMPVLFNSGNFEITSSMNLSDELSELVDYLTKEKTHV